MAFDLNNFWASESREHLDVAEKTFAALKKDFAKLLTACEKSVKAGNKILFFLVFNFLYVFFLLIYICIAHMSSSIANKTDFMGWKGQNELIK